MQKYENFLGGNTVQRPTHHQHCHNRHHHHHYKMYQHLYAVDVLYVVDGDVSDYDLISIAEVVLSSRSWR